MKSAWGLVFFALILSATLTISHALLRAAAAHTPLELPWFIRVGSALFLYGLVFFSYTVLLRYFDISILYPVYTALSIMGVSLVGIAYFGESLTLYKIFGMATLLIGIGLMSI